MYLHYKQTRSYIYTAFIIRNVDYFTVLPQAGSSGSAFPVCGGLEFARCFAGMLFENLAEIAVVAEADLIGDLIDHPSGAAEQLLGMLNTHFCQIIR